MFYKRQAASPASTVSGDDPPRPCTVLKLGDGAETSPSIDDFVSALRTWAANKLAGGDQRKGNSPRDFGWSTGRSTALLPALPPARRPPLNRRPAVEVSEDRGDESEFQNPRLPSQGVEPEATEDLGLLTLTALSESCKDVEFDEQSVKRRAEIGDESPGADFEEEQEVHLPKLEPLESEQEEDPHDPMTITEAMETEPCRSKLYSESGRDHHSHPTDASVDRSGLSFEVIKIEVPDPDVSFRVTTNPDHHSPPPRRHLLTAPRRFVTQLSLCLECDTVVDTADLWTNHHCDQVNNSSSNNSKSVSGQRVAAAPPTEAGSDHFTGTETTPAQETKARGTRKRRRKSVIKWGRDRDADSPASAATEEPPSSPSETEAEIVNRTYHVCSECEAVHTTAETLALHRRLRHHSHTHDDPPPPVLDGPYSPLPLSVRPSEERSAHPDVPHEQGPLSVAKNFPKTTESDANARWDHGISWTRCVECRQQFADVTLLRSHQEQHMPVVPLDRLMALASLIDVVARFKQREQREEREWAVFRLLNLSQ